MSSGDEGSGSERTLDSGIKDPGNIGEPRTFETHVRAGVMIRGRVREVGIRFWGFLQIVISFMIVPHPGFT